MHNEYRTIGQYRHENWKGSPDLADIYIDGSEGTIEVNGFDPALISQTLTYQRFCSCTSLANIGFNDIGYNGEAGFAACDNLVPTHWDVVFWKISNLILTVDSENFPLIYPNSFIEQFLVRYFEIFPRLY